MLQHMLIMTHQLTWLYKYHLWGQ